MSDEQRVRTMAGWIGVEISRSRVRTPGKVGFGLYRVRGSVSHRTRAELDGLTAGAVTPDGMAEQGPWTAYAFTLEAIEVAVERSISRGMPARPWGLLLHDRRGCGSAAGFPHTLPTRWTSAYRGRRNLGKTRDDALEVAQREVDELTDPAEVLDGLRAMTKLEEDLRGLERTDPVVGAASARFDEAMREIVARSTVRSRQRESNAEFQAEHMERRAHGLRARYAAKQARVGGLTQPEGTSGALRPSESD